MYEILTGKQRALVFPVMCNGHVKIDYSDNVVDTGGDSSTTNDIAYGLWAHEGSFTFESIITPYEINGYGTYSNQSAPTINNKKVMPGISQSVYTAGTQNNHQSELYLSRTARLTHEMMIFHNTNFQISLVNSTLHNENNPARYKIRVRLKLGTSTETYTTEEVIVPTNSRFWIYDGTVSSSPSLHTNASGRKTHRRVTSLINPSGATFTAGSANELFDGEKQEVFVVNNGKITSLGTIKTISGSTVTLTTTPSITLQSSQDLYLKEEYMAIYTENTFHIACTFNASSRTLNILFNGSIVKTNTHSTNSTFSFAKEDSYIGANGTGSTGAGSATTNKQFMGEIHEMSLMGVERKQFKGIDSLLPNFEDTLFYFRFEEVDL